MLLRPSQPWSRPTSTSIHEHNNKGQKKGIFQRHLLIRMMFIATATTTKTPDTVNVPVIPAVQCPNPPESSLSMNHGDDHYCFWEDDGSVAVTVKQSNVTTIKVRLWYANIFIYVCVWVWSSKNDTPTPNHTAHNSFTWKILPYIFYTSPCTATQTAEITTTFI